MFNFDIMYIVKGFSLSLFLSHKIKHHALTLFENLL